MMAKVINNHMVQDVNSNKVLQGYDTENGEFVEIKSDANGSLAVKQVGIITKEIGKVFLTAMQDTIINFPSGPVTVMINNIGPEKIYVNFDATADVNSFEIEAGSSINGIQCTDLHLFCESGSPAVQYIVS